MQQLLSRLFFCCCIVAEAGWQAAGRGVCFVVVGKRPAGDAGACWPAFWALALQRVLCLESLKQPAEPDSGLDKVVDRTVHSSYLLQRLG